MILNRFSKPTSLHFRKTISRKPKEKTKGKPSKKTKSTKQTKPTKPATSPEKKKQYNQCYYNDAKFFWIEDQPSTKRVKTWHDIEEEYCCSDLHRYSKKIQPQRRNISQHSGDIEICRRGCLQSCKLPPCDEPDYPSIKDWIIGGLKNTVAVALLVGLLYVTNKFHIWESSAGTLSAMIGDPDEKIDQVGRALIGKWNRTVEFFFSGIRKSISSKEEEEEEEEDNFNESEFLNKITENVKNDYALILEKQQTVKCGLSYEDGHVFQEWELNYSGKDTSLVVESPDCDFGWKWMKHDEDDYIAEVKPNMPYESSAKELAKNAKGKKNATLAAIYTDVCSEWTVNPCEVLETNVCEEKNSKAFTCRRRQERKNKSRINPANCKCPIEFDTVCCVAPTDDVDADPKSKKLKQ